MQAAKRIVRASGRTNKSKSAALVQTIAALEWSCPRRGAATAWKTLSSSEKQALDVAIKREIRDAEQAED